MRLEHLLSGAGMLFSVIPFDWDMAQRCVQSYAMRRGLCRFGSRSFFPASCLLYYGGLAQLARALAWHARGHRFDPDILHPPPFCEESFFDMLRQRRHKIRISVTLLSFPLYVPRFSREAYGGRAMVFTELCEKRARAHGGCLGSRRRRRTR